MRAPRLCPLSHLASLMRHSTSPVNHCQRWDNAFKPSMMCVIPVSPRAQLVPSGTSLTLGPGASRRPASIPLCPQDIPPRRSQNRSQSIVGVNLDVSSASPLPASYLHHHEGLGSVVVVKLEVLYLLRAQLYYSSSFSSFSSSPRFLLVLEMLRAEYSGWCTLSGQTRAGVDPCERIPTLSYQGGSPKLEFCYQTLLLEVV